MPASSIEYHPAFVSGANGNIFTYKLTPDARVDKKQGVIFVPAFAEEMNKSRRMFFQTARSLAEQGYTSVIFDFYGSGDSEGDFSDASWDGWCADVALLFDCLLADQITEVSVVAERTGALVIADAMVQQKLKVRKLVLWQPVVAGDAYVNQFFRLRLAAELGNESRGGSKQIKQELQEHGVTEIAGYTLSSGLLASLAEKKLPDLLQDFSGEVFWCEVVADIERQLTLLTRKTVDALEGHEVNVSLKKLVGPPFWITTEIEDIPGLVNITRQVLCADE